VLRGHRRGHGVLDRLRPHVAHLDKLGYDGYIATEYEGQRFVPLDQPVDELEQVRRHQALLASLTDNAPEA